MSNIREKVLTYEQLKAKHSTSSVNGIGENDLDDAEWKLVNELITLIDTGLSNKERRLI